jgi:hypothetical protein
MNNFFTGLSVGIIIGALALVFGVMIANAQGIPTSVNVVIPGNVTASVRCNNQNFNHSVRCQSPVDVNSFFLVGPNHFVGTLLSGVEFEQYPVAKTFSKMVIEDAFWYIDQHGTFNAEDDLQALSIHLTR